MIKFISIFIFCSILHADYIKDFEFKASSAFYAAVNQADEIIAPCYTPAKLNVYDSQGVPVEEIAGGKGNFSGVAVDSAGRIIVADSGFACVRIIGGPTIGSLYGGRIYRENGEIKVDYSQIPNDKFTSVKAVAVDRRNDNILVLDSLAREIKVFNSEGEFLFRFGGLGKTPYALTVDPLTGHIIVTDGEPARGGHYQRYCRGQIFDERGQLITHFMPEGIALGVATDSSGNIVVADILNHRIQIFDPNGVFLSSCGTFDFGPMGVAVDSQDRIIAGDLVVNSHSRFQVFKR